MSGRLPVALAVLACAMLSQPAAALGDVFEGTALVSARAGGEQVDYAHDPAISGDGRYVAFDGSFGGLTGVWRRDRQSGAVEAVSVGEVGTPAGSAELPSLSDDGRYVSFTTTAALVPGDANGAPDVYVRDMALAGSQPGAFQLASAANGSEEGLVYSYASASSEEPFYGALAAGRSAISGDGQKVAFVTTAPSDLAGPSTPAMQVAVRNLQTHETELVSSRYDAASGQTLPGTPVSASEGASTLGAVYAPGERPLPFGQTGAYHPPNAIGASISSDGSTVAWLGVDVSLQAPVLSGEALKPLYSEPLWRRIADGPGAPTRRVTGGSDPQSPACQASGETAVSPNNPSASDPCQGPFATFSDATAPGSWEGVDAADSIPRLSADGYTVALLANAPLVSQGASFGRAENHADAYVADMHAGLTRVQALRQLTELASGQGNDLATNAPILDIGISPDGQQVAFTTKRTVFPLGSPAYVTAPMTVPGMLELFDADLADDTLTRVTEGFEGGPSEHPHRAVRAGEDPYARDGDGALSPSFSHDGNTLAFASTASNLVYGDGNTPLGSSESLLFDGSDAFTIARRQFGAIATQTYISPAPASPPLIPPWHLWLTAASRRNGTVVLYAEVPAAGALHATASAAVRVPVAKPAKRRRRGRSHATVTSRAVATRAAGARAAGLVTLTLTLARHYSPLAARGGGLSSTVTVAFTAPGHATLRTSLAILFHRTVRPRRRSRTHHAHPRSRKARR